MVYVIYGGIWNASGMGRRIGMCAWCIATWAGLWKVFFLGYVRVFLVIWSPGHGNVALVLCMWPLSLAYLALPAATWSNPVGR